MKHLNILFNLLLFLSFTILVISPLSARTVGGVDCDNSVTIGTGTTVASLIAAESKDDDYFKFITGGPGEVTISFESDEEIKFYAGTTGCPISNYFLDVSSDSGTGLVTLDANTTIYIHAERTDRNANYNFTIDFIPAPAAPNLPITICYDYAYEQNGIYFTQENDGSFAPSIVGDTLDPNLPITVEFYIQNTDEGDNDIKDLVINVFDINTSQATYIRNSTQLTRPGDITAEPYPDINVSDSYNNNIIIGDLDNRDFFYMYYDLDPIRTVIDMPLNIQVNYNVTYDYGVSSSIDLPYESIINSQIPLCNINNFSYTPAYGIFNMEDSVLTHIDKYNLPTQTANRVGDFVVAAYEATNVYERKKVSTPVAVELIDAGKYDDTATSCSQVDSVVGSRIWVIFRDDDYRTDFDYTTIYNAVNDPDLDVILPLSTAEEFYDTALENAAFKLSYNGAGDGDLIQLDEVPCHKNSTENCYNVLNFTEIIKYNGGNCMQDVDGRPKNIDKIPQFCNNAGLPAASAMTEAELAICMECIYGFDVNYLCSRDNFAIRPESFRMSLNDQDQNDITQQSAIALNDNLGTNQDRNHTNYTPYHVAAGYNYALQIRATNHQNDNPTPGYNVGFFVDGNDSQRFLSLTWPVSVNPSSTFCNDTTDHNQSGSLINGGADLNLSSTQVGKYDLTIFDKLWTRVDWDPTAMTHHITGEGAGYFLRGRDCVQNTSYVPVNNTLTGNDGTNLTNVSGCNITSDNHINVDNGLKYKDIALRVHPYKFDLNGSDPIDPKIGPYTRGNGQTFVYMDTPPTMDENNTDMSYNMNGSFFAAGYNDIGSLSNFVTGCYADHVDMNLTFTYNSPEPLADKTPYLSYSLKDHNTTDKADIYRPVSGDNFEVGDHDSSIEPFIIDQNATFFVKDMRGTITMDLGYNFKRDYNNALNPRYIEFHNFNITYKTNPANIKAALQSDHKIFGDRVLDHNVTFVYGRAKPSQYFYDDVTASSIKTPISIVVYCAQDPITCSAVYNINTALGKTDEYNWYRLVAGIIVPPMTGEHITSENDGNITLVANNGGTVTSSVNLSVTDPNPGIDPDIEVSDGGEDHPLTVDIDFGTATNRWLIHNEDNNSIPTPFYRVHFIGQSGWAGHGQTGYVVDSNASSKKNRRLGW